MSAPVAPFFHTKDGLYFQPLPDGDVRVVITLNGEQPREGMSKNIYFDTVLSRGTVASLMAFASERGYNTETFYEAYEYLKVPKGD